MGSAALIASAFALILLVITAYVVVGGIISAAEIVALAQNEHVEIQESRMRTAISLSGVQLSAGGSPVYVTVENSGNEPIVDFDNMDVFLVFDDSPVYYPRGSATGSWNIVQITPDRIHPGQLDPGEELNLSVQYAGVDTPVWVQVTTPNGVYDSAYIAGW